MRILVVDADDVMAERLARDLRRHGHDVGVARDGQDALERFRGVEVVLTELDLPDVDGTAICRTVISESDVAVLVVSHRTEEIDRVLALQAGADDYLVKPYGLPELLARVEAVTRRCAPTGALRSKVIAHSGLRIDPSTYEVHVGGRPIEVTRKEFDLLKLLASEPCEVVTRQRIMSEVWEDNWTPSNGRTIDTHVNSLRRKLGDREWIRTVRGVGFRIGSVLMVA